MGNALAFRKQGVDHSSKLNLKFNQHQICYFTISSEILQMFMRVLFGISDLWIPVL